MAVDATETEKMMDLCFICESPQATYINLFDLQLLLDVPSDQLSNEEEIRLCKGCSEQVGKARELYQQIVNIAKEFRCIQSMIVCEIRGRRKRRKMTGKADDDPLSTSQNQSGPGAEDLEQFVRNYDYNFADCSLLIRFGDFENKVENEEVPETYIDDNDEFMETETPINCVTTLKGPDCLHLEESVNFLMEDENEDSYSDIISSDIMEKPVVNIIPLEKKRPGRKCKLVPMAHNDLEIKNEDSMEAVESPEEDEYIKEDDWIPSPSDSEETNISGSESEPEDDPLFEDKVPQPEKVKVERKGKGKNLSPKHSSFRKLTETEKLTLEKLNSKSCSELKCHLCSTILKTRKGLSTHLVRKHGVIASKRSCHMEKDDSSTSLTCKICSRICKNRSGLGYHMTTIHGIRGAQSKEEHQLVKPKVDICCEICGENKSGLDILEHVRSHVGEDYLRKCPNPECPQVFCHMIALRKHVKRGSCRFKLEPSSSQAINFNTRVSSCEECGAGGSNLETLRAHISRTHEGGPRERRCPISGCDETFVVRQSVDIHLFLNHDLSNHNIQKCFDCSERIKVDEMGEHLLKKHKPAELIRCKQCPFLFSSREHLIEHMFLTHRYSGVPFSCDICSGAGVQVTIPDHLQLRQHYFECHQIGKQYVCEICQKVCWTLALLNCHKNVVHIKKHVCEICKGFTEDPFTVPSFSSAGKLSQHKIQVHGAEPFKCQFCQETFVTRHSWAAHVKEIHKRKQSTYRCGEPQCDGRSFKNQESLKAHMKCTHGEKKYICVLCGKGFSNKRYLRIHVNGVHLGLRPEICETCGDGFSTKANLQRHMLIHTGDRPFACEECGQRFRFRNALTTHLKCHQEKGNSFKRTGPMKNVRKRKPPEAD